jgi:uncharacterized protein YecT (DUF1311 family)
LNALAFIIAQTGDFNKTLRRLTKTAPLDRRRWAEFIAARKRRARAARVGAPMIPADSRHCEEPKATKQSRKRPSFVGLFRFARNDGGHAVRIAFAIGCALAAGSARAQGHAPPRKIAPEQFPDYGVRAPAAAPSALASITLIAPTPEHPLGACKRDMPTGDWLRCLRMTVDLADEALAAVTTRIKSGFAARADTNDIMRKAWGRALDESQVRWRGLRDYECQQLAMAEPEAPKELFEARLTCAIRGDIARGKALAARYRLDE